MADTGGRFPYDAAGALAGPCRVVYAAASVDLPDDLWDIVAAEADVDGDIPLVTGWKDFGLAATAPTVHAREVAGLTYQQPSTDLFEDITEITRSATVQILQIDKDNLRIVENTQIADTAAAAAAQQPAGTKVHFGLYDTFLTYRIAFISYRPSGAAIVTELDRPDPAPGGGARAASVRACPPTPREVDLERGKPGGHRGGLHRLPRPGSHGG